MVLYYGTMSTKLFTKLNIFIAFLALLFLQFSIHSVFYIYHMSGLSVLGICGVLFSGNTSISVNMVIFYQTETCLLVFGYGLNIYLGVRVVRKIREHIDGVSEGFEVSILLSKYPYGNNIPSFLSECGDQGIQGNPTTPEVAAHSAIFSIAQYYCSCCEHVFGC